MDERNFIPWAGAVLLTLATFFLIFGGSQLKIAAPNSIPFELRANETAGQMEIHWDVKSDEVTRAQSAVFEVKDGDSLYRFPLSPRVLAAGSVEYVRKSDDVAATLILLKDDQELARRTVRSVGGPRGR